MISIAVINTIESQVIIDCLRAVARTDGVIGIDFKSFTASVC